MLCAFSLKKALKYTEFANVIGLDVRGNGTFTHHLKKLIEAELIEKFDNEYLLSLMGEKVFTWMQMEEAPPLLSEILHRIEHLKNHILELEKLIKNQRFLEIINESKKSLATIITVRI